MRNVLISQDIARGYQRHHISPRCLLKIDLQKAFDSVRWEFIRELLAGLKFPLVFVQWIMACITSVYFKIHINGQDHESFKGGRGLKQGEPLSPLLFVLSMEYLSRLLAKTSLNSKFKFHPSCKKIQLTHLIFADDLILFSKAGPDSLHLMMSALQDFHDCAGLKTNLQNHK